MLEDREIKIDWLGKFILSGKYLSLQIAFIAAQQQHSYFYYWLMDF